MMFSEITQQLASTSKEVAITLFKATLKNFDSMIKISWDVTQSYIDMEQNIKAQKISKEEAEIVRVPYDRQQINLEKTFETCSNVLWFFIDSDSGNPNNYPSDAITTCKDIALDTLNRVISTPLVASACSNMFPVFIESSLQILITLGGETTTEFIKQVLMNTDQ